MSGEVWGLLPPPPSPPTPAGLLHFTIQLLPQETLEQTFGVKPGLVLRSGGVDSQRGGGIRLVCNSCWSIKYARAQNVGVKLVPLRREPSSARKAGEENVGGAIARRLCEPKPHGGWMLSHCHHQSVSSQISAFPLRRGIQWDSFEK